LVKENKVMAQFVKATEANNFKADSYQDQTATPGSPLQWYTASQSKEPHFQQDQSATS